MRLVQISDTHFGTEVRAVATAATRAIHALAPDVVVLAGDITQRARRAQFAAARRFMDGLPRDAARLAIPGNHDIPLLNIWARAFRPYSRYTRAFGAREALWHRGGVAILALDATSPRRHKNGALDDAHLQARLGEARVACGPAGLLVVVVHQPLWTAWGADRRQTLIGRHAIAHRFAAASVDLVLTGHVHVPLIETSETSDPALPWRFVMSGSGTAVSERTRPGAPNSFNVVTLDPDAKELRVTRHDHLDGEFRPVAEKRFRRQPRGWFERAAAAA